MKKINRSSRRSSRQPRLELRPAAVPQGATLLAAGSGWPLYALSFLVDGEPRQPNLTLRGSAWSGQLVPDGEGAFLVEFSTQDLQPGGHRLAVRAAGQRRALEVEFKVEARVTWGPQVPRPQLDKPYMRGQAFKQWRTGGQPGWPAGFLETAHGDWRRRQPLPQPQGGITFFSAPLPGACNWLPLGPAPFTTRKTSSQKDNSGRIRSIAIDPALPSRMYVGTASGGVWKSLDGGISWLPKSDNQFSLAIGALAIDPASTNIVYAGTGEMVPGSDYGHYYGRGLLKSTNFGEIWTEIGASQFELAEIARIVINPLDSADLFVAASNGLWEGSAGGGSWVRLSENPCTDVVLVQNPATPGVRKLLAGFSDLGVYQATDSGAGWSAFAAVAVTGAPAAPKRVVFGVCRTQPRYIYAAFAEAGAGNMLAHLAKSEDWGANWAARPIPVASATDRLYQAFYNLAVLPHPSDHETVFLAVVDLFKTSDSGGIWTNVSYGIGGRVHADCQALAHHPGDPNRLFVASDGGLFHTPDAAVSWQARNLDLSTLQLYDLGQHPQYAGIMIAGSQDNGGFHYSGAPIWRRTWVPFGITINSMDGDAVVTKIDPFDPYYHYYGTGPESYTYRSNDAGRLFSSGWSHFPGTQWWAPFYPDPRSAGVLFTGGFRLMRSDNRGGSWTQITAELDGPLRAIGFHPTDPLVLYAGTTLGKVYRVVGPAAGVWDETTVTVTDVTSTGLPAGKGISSLAVDPSGNVWATISDLMMAEGSGEFSHDHVFRLDAGAASWSAKSVGLAVANPINTIVIDPADAARVFCGGDRGVFAWNAALAQWQPLDQGLPNAPVVKLLIHGPARLLRAATYGRGVWERSLDGLACPDHFIYFRDNMVDTGVTPSPDGVPHPYVSGEHCWHWQSEDIVVDAYNQTPSLATTPTQLGNEVAHFGARRGSNRIYVTVHNKGPFAVTNVRVRAFFAAASAGLPGFPAGLLANPFAWSPGGPAAWNPVGAFLSIPRIEPGTTRLAAWEFVIPDSAPRHSCLLAFTTSSEDPFVSGGITNPDQLVVKNRKVTLKNLDLEHLPVPGEPDSGGGASPAAAGATAPRQLALYGRERQGNLFDLRVHCGNVPRGAVLVAALDKKSRRRLEEEEAKLSRAGQKARQEFADFKHPVELKGYDLEQLIVRDAKPCQRLDLGRLILDSEQPARIVLWLYAPKWDKRERYAYHLVQYLGERVAGGFSVEIGDLQI